MIGLFQFQPNHFVVSIVLAVWAKNEYPKSVLVLLGSLDLRQPFSYHSIADIVRLMFMSYARRTLAKKHQINQDRLIQQAEKTLQIIHRFGVFQSRGERILG